MSVSRSSRRLTFIQVVLLCVCVVNTLKADATLKDESDAYDNGFIRRRTIQSTDYTILPSGAIQLPSLSSTYPPLHSGPILILDQSTLYITSLRYDGTLPDVQFRASNNTSNGSDVLLFVENDSANELHAHWGQNVYLKLPDNITIYNIEYIYVRSRISGVTYGNIEVPSNIKVPEKRGTEDKNGRKLIWLPKCCNIGETYGSEGCNKSLLQFSPQTGFFEMNNTHINNESLSYECAEYEPYVNLIECKDGKIALYPEEDQFLYLQNGSLMYIDERLLVPQDQYCVETIEEIEATVPFICLRPRGTPEVIYYIYASGMLVSCVFYILTGAIFYFVFEDCKVRIRCIILYSFCTAGSFATLSSAQWFHVEGETCNALGYILEFFFVLSYAWLTVLSYETQYIIRRPPKERYRNRFRIYCGISITIAVVLVTITVAMSEIPFLPEQILKPQFGRNSCVFDEQSYKTYFFYVPIFTGIFISIGYLAYAKYLIVKKSEIEEENNRINQYDLKNKFRASWILVAISTMCWIMEVISFALNSQSGMIVAMDMVECLQGLFVFIIFVLHNPVKDKLAAKLCSSKSQNQNGNVVDENFLDRLTEMEELRPLHAMQQQQQPQNCTFSNKPPTVISDLKQ